MLVPFIAAAFMLHAGDGLPVKTPASVGMSAKRLAVIDRVVARGVRAGGYPGAAVVVGRKGAAVWQRGFGRLDWRTGSSAVSPNTTIYDIASLTKVVGTTTAIMVLFDEGRIDLDAPVATYIPSFQGGSKDRVTVRHLLEHRSGLAASRDLWRVAFTPDDARRAVIESPLVCQPGNCFIYSDLGAALLGFVVESITGMGLDAFLEERVYAPLGMSDTFFRPAQTLRDRIAPTEVTPPRGYPLRGEVHDENAYALGGVSGHAGLFSTAADLSIFAQMLLNGGEYNGVRILSDSTVRLFTNRAAGSRALGWAMADGTGGSGRYLSDGAYGHTGYTGTSMWIDPDREMFVILLTNRVHAARARRPAKVISDVRADLADAAAIAVTDDPDAILAMPAAFRADRAVGWNRTARRTAYYKVCRKVSGKTKCVMKKRVSKAKKSASRGKSSRSKKAAAKKSSVRKTSTSKSTAKRTS
ncbi:MAG TPA: serine hydrolase [Gemmatimonadaceae bacterium]|nr:serine hydrolase [Gemmatimonadaceae bacterium]